MGPGTEFAGLGNARNAYRSAARTGDPAWSAEAWKGNGGAIAPPLLS